MARESKICLVLLLTIFYFITISEGFDSFWMIHQWPPSVCNRKGLSKPCTGPVESMFTINGFWPHSHSGQQKINCNPDDRFDHNKIISIEADLRTYWPDVENDNNRNLWSQEWKQRGTCSNFDQLTYFQQALNNRLSHEYDLEGILHNAGITPTGDSPYSLLHTKEAIAKSTGKKPILRCNINKVSNRSQLVDIILCFKVDSFTLIDCPDEKDQCPQAFVWLPHNPANIAIVTDH